MSKRLQAIVAQKCPVCFQGAVFRSSVSMNEFCSNCGTRFEREQGYFMGALYVAHALTMPILSVLTLLCWLLGLGSVGRSFFPRNPCFPPCQPRHLPLFARHLDAPGPAH